MGINFIINDSKIIDNAKIIETKYVSLKALAVLR